MENTNLKAYFRRGQGHFQLKNLDLAWKDLKRAVKLSPEDEIVEGVGKVRGGDGKSRDGGGD